MDGLDLDVLRPATFARLSQVLHAAYDAGPPYHVVHFDGHGTWLDVAAWDAEPEGPTRGCRVLPARVPGVAGCSPRGRGSMATWCSRTRTPRRTSSWLMARPWACCWPTGVPVPVLNACRSAYAEARAGAVG